MTTETPTGAPRADITARIENTPQTEGRLTASLMEVINGTCETDPNLKEKRQAIYERDATDLGPQYLRNLPALLQKVIDESPLGEHVRKLFQDYLKVDTYEIGKQLLEKSIICLSRELSLAGVPRTDRTVSELAVEALIVGLKPDMQQLTTPTHYSSFDRDKGIVQIPLANPTLGTQNYTLVRVAWLEPSPRKGLLKFDDGSKTMKDRLLLVEDDYYLQGQSDLEKLFAELTAS